jgi:putative transposase
VKFAFIRAHRGGLSAKTMCRLFGVSRSGFYAAARRPEAPRHVEQRRITSAIRVIHCDGMGLYGSPRMFRELRRQGLPCGRHRAARLMRKNGIKARRRRGWRPMTTTTDRCLPVAPNILKQNFTVAEPNRVWVGDITFIATREGWLYLAVILDLFSRRVVGWAMDRVIDRHLTLRALRMALTQRRPAPGLIHHTDRGSQYASTDYQIELEGKGLICSMSRKGNCYDNAVAESFFSTFKIERVEGSNWIDREQAQAATFEYIEGFYNPRRMHSSLGYRSPVEFEKVMLYAQ